MDDRIIQCEWEYNSEGSTSWLGKRKLPNNEQVRPPSTSLKCIAPRRRSRTSSYEPNTCHITSEEISLRNKSNEHESKLSEPSQIKEEFPDPHRPDHLLRLYPTSSTPTTPNPTLPIFRRPPQRKIRRFVTLLGCIVACSEDFKSGWMRTRSARRANHQKQIRYLINVKDAEQPNGKIVISVFDTGKSKVLARIVTTHGGYDSGECNLINLSRFSTLKLYPNELKMIEVFGDVSDSKNEYISENLYFQSFDLKSRVSQRSPHVLLVKSGRHQYTTHTWTVTISYDGQQLLIGGLMNVKYQPKPVQFIRSLSIPSIFEQDSADFTCHGLLPTLEPKYESIPQVAPGFALVSLGSEAPEELEEELIPDGLAPAASEASVKPPKIYLSRSKCIFQILSFPVQPDLSPKTPETIPKVIYSSTKYPV